MKYGIIVFKDTENIGDDIQSYAASKLLPQVDYYIEREHIDTFVPKNKEMVKVIMNGWFMHYKHNFIPSPYIKPIFVSTHFSSYDTYGIKNEYIKLNTSYLKEYQPIGCRDLHSKQLLEQYNIDAYVSGCVTLTLNKFNTKLSEEEYICCVDISEDVEKYLKEHSPVKIISKTHKVKSSYNKKLTYDERFKNVEDLLKLYQNAKLVVTSRLHCALPCIALGTPVILVKDNKSIYYKDRIETFLEYINHYSEEELLKEDINKLLSLKNSSKYIDLKSNIISKVNNELKSSKLSIDGLPEVNDFNNIYVKRKKRIDKMLDVIMKNYLKLYNDNYNNKSASLYWKKQYDDSIRLKDEAIDQNNNYWKKQFNDLLENKELAVKQNDDYWRKEYNSLLEKYNKLLK